ncbi:MAG: DUF4173 domain-containing protein [Pseudomonadota bacterium]
MIRYGVPNKLRQDAWWLEPAGLSRGAARVKTPAANWPLLGALVLGIALADFLFWKGGASLALILFVQGVTALALWLYGQWVTNKTAALYAGVSILSALPWFVHIQPSAFLFLLLGHLAIIGHAMTGRWDGFALRFLTAWLPLSFWASICGGIETIQISRQTRISKSGLKDLFLPLSALLIFGLLFALANPIIETQIEALLRFELPEWLILRGLFWGIFGFILLPVLWANRFANWTGWKVTLPIGLANPLTQRTITSTLLVCNLIFALQMGLDISILFAGATLPEGMSYAEYAHRGAYPLAATAMLALGFMLLAHGHARTSKTIRVLLFIWIAQNAMLLGAAGYRLALYIDVYGLTYMRLYGGVGMIWVAIALALMILLLMSTLPRVRMIQALALIAVSTIYGFSLVNVAQVIAAQNLKMAVAKADPDWLDRRYLCGLMPHGVEALNQHIAQTGDDPLADLYWSKPRHMKNWRGWSLRTMKIKAATARYKQL